MTPGDEFLALLAHQPAVLVTVQSHRGSVPRESGAWMAVFADRTLATIGGGHLEWQATAEARRRLTQGSAQALLRYALGPTLGQCCGGEVHLLFEGVDARHITDLRRRFDRERSGWPRLALFGAGHVGQALVWVLARLPLQVRWIDDRDESFSVDTPANVRCESSDPAHSVVPLLEPGSQVLIMSYSHVQDFDLLAACLQRQRQHGDLGQIGMIGSRSKWAAFRRRLQARGFAPEELDRVVCPIGVPGIAGKEPEVIAVGVAAQVLQAAGRNSNAAAD